MSTLYSLVTSALEGLYQLTVHFGIPSYALAIILLTVIIKMVLYPLTYKQMKSMRAMQELQPKIKELDKKYKNDPAKKQEAMMAIYKEHGANPLSGCLPLLIQLPILWALYGGLRDFNPTNIEHYNFFWIPDLSKTDPTGFLLPLLVGVTTFLQQWITTPKTNDPTQKTMLYVMPIIFGWITKNFPAGLALYWMIFNIVGTIQQIFINKGIKPAPVKEEIKNEISGKNRKNN